MTPTVSIITPLLNRASLLPDALASVASQASESLEHIVIDGGSTDGSQIIATKAGARVVDATGSSIYTAINLGLCEARGELICLLNSDDKLAAGALAAAREAFAAMPNLELVRGSSRIETRTDTRYEPATTPTLHNVLLKPANINACIFRKSLVDRVGSFDTRYHIAADREWLARAILSDARVSSLDHAVAIYRSHAGSLTIGGNKSAAVRWVAEHIAFSRALLHSAKLCAADRSTLRAFHAKETVHLAVLKLTHGAPWSAVKALAGGLRADALWPFYAAGPLTSIALRRLREIA